MRIIEPPYNELGSLRTPLNPGEMKVLDFFNHSLSDDWEIYIQPHLNGHRPDFVLLNPTVGIAVFEVKGWDFNAMRYFEKDGRLFAEKDETIFPYQKENPIPKLGYYKEDILNVYCPRIGMNFSDTSSSWSTVTIGAIFPFAPSKVVKSLFSQFFTSSQLSYLNRYNLIWGKEELETNNIEKIFPEATRKSSKYMIPELAADLRGWLVEPEFSREQRHPVLLDKNQSNLAFSKAKYKYRRIKGCAGSGKSLVLAARAAYLASEGKNILICTFNITLTNYLRDLVASYLISSKDMQHITILHFHGLCKRICYDNGYGEEYKNCFKALSEKELQSEEWSGIPNDHLMSLVNKIIDNEDVTKYDAALVDEGQDLKPSWWNIIKKLVNDDGERLLIADSAQDIYDRSKSWTSETMKGAGFTGAWNILYSCYRLPVEIYDIANFYINNFLPQLKPYVFKKNQLPPNQQRELFPCVIKWKKSHPNDTVVQAIECITELMKLAGKDNNKAISDICLICDKKSIGRDIVNSLNEKKIKVNHTFYEDKYKDKKSKISFFKGDARIKATTLHSFKGWEGSIILLVISDLESVKSKFLFYVGLTRLKRSTNGSFMTILYSGEDPQLSSLEAYINERKFI